MVVQPTHFFPHNVHNQCAHHCTFTSCCGILAAPTVKICFKYITIHYNLFDLEVTQALLVATAVFTATVEAEHISQSF